MLSVSPNPSITYTTLFEDGDLLVVAKRAGLVTQPGKGHDGDALLNGLFARYGKQLQRLGQARDYGLLHRLDKNTSGLLAVGLTARAYDGLRRQFQARTVRKFYWALCAKAPKGPSAGLINKPLLETMPRDFTEQKLAKISLKGKPAQTAYRTLAVAAAGPFAGSALIECRPLTGRLHQVRVHLEAVGCPIYGDELYAPAPIARVGPRLGLHAHRLAFTHPFTGVPIDISTPFPRDLRTLLTKLGLPRPDESAKPRALDEA
ncbi:MAG: RluA family pseudouridine synthase [Phycisphaerales bacterium]|nr:RluA family pseudouridine synthase [Phycisphaerales bacterium]